MVDAIRSDTPTAVISPDVANEALQIAVTNPTPTGSRPAVTTNYIYRRATGSSDPWSQIGSTSTNGTFFDWWTRSTTSFDYFVRTDSGADSVTYTATSPTITGMWAYAVGDTTTLMHFRYTDGHGESLDVIEQAIQLVGRVSPIFEAGIQETQTYAVNATIPLSEANWRAQVDWWRARKRGRQTLLYRDGRGRMDPVRISGPVSIAPVRQGAQITATLTRVDYIAQQNLLDPAYYQGGAYNDGGNGIYGNGSQGNGF